MSELLAFIPGVIALAGVLVGWWRSSRKMSGQIRTSEAEALWEESRDIRKEYRERLQAVEQRNRELEERVAKCEDLNNILGMDNRQLRDANSRLERELEEARSA